MTQVEHNTDDSTMDNSRVVHDSTDVFRRYTRELSNECAETQTFLLPSPPPTCVTSTMTVPYAKQQDCIQN